MSRSPTPPALIRRHDGQALAGRGRASGEEGAGTHSCAWRTARANRHRPGVPRASPAASREPSTGPHRIHRIRTIIDHRLDHTSFTATPSGIVRGHATKSVDNSIRQRRTVDALTRPSPCHRSPSASDQWPSPALRLNPAPAGPRPPLSRHRRPSPNPACLGRRLQAVPAPQPAECLAASHTPRLAACSSRFRSQPSSPATPHDPPTTRHLPRVIPPRGRLNRGNAHRQKLNTCPAAAVIPSAAQRSRGISPSVHAPSPTKAHLRELDTFLAKVDTSPSKVNTSG